MLVSQLAAFCAAASPAASAEPSQSPAIHHDLHVAVDDPATHRLKVNDRIRVPGALVTAPFTLSLNADLNVQAVYGGLKLVPTGSRVPDSGIDRGGRENRSGVHVNIYRVEGATPGQESTTRAASTTRSGILVANMRAHSASRRA